MSGRQKVGSLLGIILSPHYLANCSTIRPLESVLAAYQPAICAFRSPSTTVVQFGNLDFASWIVAIRVAKKLSLSHSVALLTGAYASTHIILPILAVVIRCLFSPVALVSIGKTQRFSL